MVDLAELRALAGCESGETPGVPELAADRSDALIEVATVQPAVRACSLLATGDTAGHYDLPRDSHSRNFVKRDLLALSTIAISACL